jgi:predicted metallo-beta-lactamase superfamily hydrolase
MNPELSPTHLVLTPPEAVVIHCSDYRFQAAIRTFLGTITTHSFDVLVIPGGPHFAAAHYFLPKQHTVGKQHIKFLVEFHQLKRLILIDHADCGFFKHYLSHFHAEPTPNEKQTANLKKACAIIQEWFPTLLVDAYFAEVHGADSVRFIKMT